MYFDFRKWRNQYILAPAHTPRGERDGGEEGKRWIHGGVQENEGAGEKEKEKGEGEEGKSKKGLLSLFGGSKEGDKKSGGSKKGDKKSGGDSSIPVSRSRTPNPPTSSSPSPQSPKRLRSPSVSSSSPRRRSPSISHSPRPLSPHFDTSVGRPRSPSISHSPVRPRDRESDIVISPSRTRSPSSPWVSPTSRPLNSPTHQEIKLSPCRSPVPSPGPPKPPRTSPRTSPRPFSPSAQKNNLLLTLGFPPTEFPSPSPPPPPRTSFSLESLDKLGEDWDKMGKAREKEAEKPTKTNQKSGAIENFVGLGGLDQFIEKYGQTSDNFGQFGDNFGTLTFDIPADLALPLFAGGAGKEVEEKEEEAGKLFVDFASVESLNKNGLRRGKKEMTKV